MASESSGCTVLAFDLDGTLLQGRPGLDYDDPDQVAALEPIEAAIRRLAALRRQGHGIAVITGRPESMRLLTQLQVSVIAGKGVTLDMQTGWLGVAHLTSYKAEALRSKRASLFVGDSVSDRMAAERAGVPFMTAQDFSDGQPLPLPRSTHGA